MGGFLSKIFGGSKKKNGEAHAIIEDTLSGVVEKSGFDLSFDINDGENENEYTIEFFGEDEELLKDKEGQLLDAFQLYMTRVIQHQLPEARVNLEFDCNGYREEANQELVELAEKLKDIVISKKKSVYFRALPPKDRKVVHQFLAEDERVKSRSIGDGLYKKIKIFPADGGPRPNGRGERSENNGNGDGRRARGKGRGPRRNRNRNRQNREETTDRPDNFGNRIETSDTPDVNGNTLENSNG